MRIVCFIEFSLSFTRIYYQLIDCEWRHQKIHSYAYFFLYLAEYFCIFIFHHSKNEIRIRDKNIPVLLQTTIQIWAIQAEIHWIYHRQQVAKFCHFISLWTLIDVCHFMESFFYDFSIHLQQTKEQFTKKNIRKTLSPDSFEKKSIDRNRCRTSKVIHIQIRNNQERDSVSDFTLACDSRWHHFESTPPCSVSPKWKW